MSLRIFAIVTASALTTLSAVSAVGPSQPMHLRPNAAGTSVLHVAGSRSAQQMNSSSGSKFDASLAEIARHVGSLRPGSELQDLHALNPAARFSRPADSSSPLVLIDAITKDDPQKLKAALVGLGFAARRAVFQRCRRMAAGRSIGRRHRLDRGPCHPRGDDAHQERGGHLARRLCAEQRFGALGQFARMVRGLPSECFPTAMTVIRCTPPMACPRAASTVMPIMDSTPRPPKTSASGDLPASVNVIEDATCMNYGAPDSAAFRR